MPVSRQYRQGLIWQLVSREAACRAVVPSKLDVGLVSLLEGFRAGVACAVPVFVGEIFNYPDLTWAAIAAFWICLADPGGPIRTRFAALATLAILGAVSCAVSIWATALSIWLAIVLGFVWSFAGSLAGIYGEAAAKIGQFVLVTFLVAIGNFEGRTFDPGQAAWLYSAGACWALMFTLILWPIHPHGPSRRALATVYDELARFVTELAQLRSAAKLEGDPWGAMARDRRRRIREALVVARVTIATIGRMHLGKSRRADQLLMLLQYADQIFAALIALSELLERDHGKSSGAAFDASLTEKLDRIRALLGALSAAILTRDRLPRPLLFDPKLPDPGPLDAGPPRSTTVALYRHLIGTVLHYLSDAADVAADTTWRPHSGELIEPLSANRGRPREALLALLGQNLTGDSVALHHALRLAVAASIALFITLQFELGHGYWLTMTTVLILQPYAATTWQLSLKRIIGSVLGGILAAALGIVFHTPLAIALVVFPIAVATMIFRTIDYGLYVLFLTPQFVLISALAEPGTGNLDLSWLRAVNSILGGALALAAAVLLWPGKEVRYLPNELAKAIAANRAYLSQVRDALHQFGQSGTVDSARGVASLASNNAEASVQRLLSEPGNDPVILEAAMTIVTSLRRLTGAITLVWLLPRERTPPQTMPGSDALYEWIDDALQAMANETRCKAVPAALKERPELPQIVTVPEDRSQAEAIARVCRHIEIMHAALKRFADCRERC